MSKSADTNSIRKKRDVYLEDMAKVIVHMKRFKKAVTDARIKWDIPGGLPYDQRAAWYQSFFMKPDKDIDNSYYTNSERELIPPSKLIRSTLKKISDDFNLDPRWHNSLFNHIAADNVPLESPSGLPYVEIRLNDARLPKEKWVVKRMWVELYADTTQKDFAAIWKEQIEPYQAMMDTQFPKKRRPMENVEKYIKIRNLEDANMTHQEIVDSNPEFGFLTYKDLSDFKQQIEERFSHKK